jgi:alcohol dehydrogenase, propanol-preferring
MGRPVKGRATEPIWLAGARSVENVGGSASDVAKTLQALGGAQAVLATASGGKAVAAALGGLRRGGVVISLGATDEPIELSAFELLFKQLGVDGALTGTPAAGDATLKFSTLSDVAAMIETMPLERAAEAYARMMSGKARFRMVLTMG